LGQGLPEPVEILDKEGLRRTAVLRKGKELRELRVVTAKAVRAGAVHSLKLALGLELLRAS
jgi:hypothetical protein